MSTTVNEASSAPFLERGGVAFCGNAIEHVEQQAARRLALLGLLGLEADELAHLVDGRDPSIK